MATKIILVDDQPIVRNGIARIVTSDPEFEAVAEFSSGEAALRAVDTLCCDLCITALALPGMGGFEFITELGRIRPALPILVVTTFPERVHGVRCLSEGAAGYITKAHDPCDLLDAVRTVASGRRYVTPELSQILAARVAGAVTTLPHEELSSREYEVFRRLVTGESCSEIARSLCISAKTVSTYRTRVLAKMQVERNAELTAYAIEHGLLDGSHPRVDAIAHDVTATAR